MISPLFRRNSTVLRQKCREWFFASRHSLLAYARQQVDDITDVELLISDVTRKVTEAIISGRVPIADITPYTLRSLFNKASELRKKNAKRLDTERQYAEEESIHTRLSQNDSPTKLEDQHVLARNYIRNLSDDIASVVTLRFWGELTFSEIANKLNIPETSVRRKYEKGIQQLKQYLLIHEK